MNASIHEVLMVTAWAISEGTTERILEFQVGIEPLASAAVVGY